MSPEWSYLFDQAGVTRDMLQNKSTLQFILDTVLEMGGAPQEFTPSKKLRKKLQVVDDDDVDDDNSEHVPIVTYMGSL